MTVPTPARKKKGPWIAGAAVAVVAVVAVAGIASAAKPKESPPRASCRHLVFIVAVAIDNDGGVEFGRHLGSHPDRDGGAANRDPGSCAGGSSGSRTSAS